MTLQKIFFFQPIKLTKKLIHLAIPNKSKKLQKRKDYLVLSKLNHYFQLQKLKIIHFFNLKLNLKIQTYFNFLKNLKSVHSQYKMK